MIVCTMQVGFANADEPMEIIGIDIIDAELVMKKFGEGDMERQIVRSFDDSVAVGVDLGRTSAIVIKDKLEIDEKTGEILG